MNNYKYKLLEKIVDSEMEEEALKAQYFYWDDYDNWDIDEPEEIIDYSYEEIEEVPTDKYVVRKFYKGKIPTSIVKINKYTNIRKIDMMSIYPIDVLRNKKIDIILSED